MGPPPPPYDRFAVVDQSEHRRHPLPITLALRHGACSVHQLGGITHSLSLTHYVFTLGGALTHSLTHSSSLLLVAAGKTRPTPTTLPPSQGSASPSSCSSTTSVRAPGGKRGSEREHPNHHETEGVVNDAYDQSLLLFFHTPCATPLSTPLSTTARHHGLHRSGLVSRRAQVQELMNG